MLRQIHLNSRGKITTQDYRLVSSFFTERGGSAPPAQLLPTLGVIYDDIACAFMYLDATGSGVAVLAWTATDPRAPLLKRAKALHGCISFMEAEAKALGYGYIMCSQGVPSLVRHFKKRGYTPGDSGLVHLFNTTNP